MAVSGRCVNLAPSSRDLDDDLIGQADDGLAAVADPPLVDTDLVRAGGLTDADAPRLHLHGIERSVLPLDDKGVGLLHLGQVDLPEYLSLLGDLGDPGLLGVQLAPYQYARRQKHHGRQHAGKDLGLFVHR